MMVDLPDNMIEDEKFGRIYNATTFIEFATLLMNAPKIITPRYWRGQSDIGWRIEPSVVRRLTPVMEDAKRMIPPITLELEQWVREYESKILSQAREAGYGIQDGRILNDLELFALIQHYGGATRLLDFTHNIYLALWFACNDKKNIDKPGLVIGFDMDRHKLEELKLPHEMLNMKRIYHGFNTHKSKCFLWQPEYALPRMLAQQSVFIISLCYEDHIEKTTLPTHKTSTDYTSIDDRPDLFCIRISCKLKNEMKKKWDLFFGYTLRTTFPDLPGFAQSHKTDASLDFGFFSRVKRQTKHELGLIENLE